ncbi:MAG: FAD-dependent monooxygenase, partial [Hyphomicrobiaceae bacterium]
MARPTHHACVVIGGGPAGLAAAATLALAGLDVALAAGSSPGTGRAAGSRDAAAAAETRTAALFPPAIALLERLGAWGELAPLCAPLTAIRLVDSSGSVLKAPQIVFSAGDLGLSNLGYNVPNDGLVEALRGAARRLGVTVLDNGLATSVRAGADIAHVDLVGGQQISADLLVAADGRGSATREAAGIAVRRWTYEQAALSCRFHHSRPHGGVSTELHGPAGPCTTVPLPGNASSLVWMDHPTEIERLK